VINFNDNLGLLGNLAGQDLSERDQRASRDAYQAFKQLVDQFPASRYAADARLRMDYIVNTLASYEVHVARYYYNRGAYVAAANRAQQAVTEFQQAPALEEALHMMVLSYDKLQLQAAARRCRTRAAQELPQQPVPHGVPARNRRSRGGRSGSCAFALPHAGQHGQPVQRFGLVAQHPHRRQRRLQTAAVAHLAQPRIADHQQAVVGFRADQPPRALLQ
jgi:tetratricopeptide (TPR) repeat protein